MRESIYVIFLLFSSLSLMAQKKVELSELNLSDAKVVFGSAEKNKSVTNNALTVRGKQYDSGVGVSSGTEMFVWLDGKGNRFRTKVGVNDRFPLPKKVKSNVMTAGERLYYVEGKRHNFKFWHFKGLTDVSGEILPGSVVFEIRGDGALLWSSEVMKKGDRPKSANVDLSGVKILKLSVTDAGDGPSGDHADWLETVLEYEGDRPFLVDENYGASRSVSDGFFKKHLAPKLAKVRRGQVRYPDHGEADWLLNPAPWKAEIRAGDDGRSLELGNGLITRTFRLSPNLATVGFDNHMENQAVLRAVSPEGRLTIDGKTYTLGGLHGERERGYFKKAWLDDLFASPEDFFVADFEIGEIQAPFPWKQTRWSLVSQYPAKGKRLVFTLKHHAEALEGVTVKVYYEMYDGLPLLGKWIEVKNGKSVPLTVNKFSNEVLAVVEAESSKGKRDEIRKPNIHVESDYAFHNSRPQGASKVTTRWERDLKYTSQPNYRFEIPCVLESRPPIGPNQKVLPGDSFMTFRTFELVHDSHDRERKGLGIRRMYRALAPWAFENPIYMHVRSTDPKIVKRAIDQCAETGYEMVSLTFGSGLNFEDDSPANIAKFKALSDYAKSKGIALGGYSLLSSRRISESVDVINPETGKRRGVIHGGSPCLGTEWANDYFRKLKEFYEKTGFSQFTHDGSYPGQICASKDHKYHKGEHDSQWVAWKRITDFYKWLRSRGAYMNVPDFYFLSGSNKAAVGYREVNWSLPRERQIVLGRQNIYDGLWDRAPSMCWTFTPLVEYHGGGAQATLEPLKDHLKEYEAHMAQNYGSGIQSTYRGMRLYDSPATKALVIRMINWYKRYRAILSSDIIHVRRPDGRDYDAVLHVNPELKEKGFAMIYNPTERHLKKKIKLPMYYTGIKGKAIVKKEGGEAVEVNLNRNYDMEIEIDMEPNSYTWYVLESGDEDSL
ncbi:hypothetical protein FUAX_28380 [Fulvitalea axinellae]|uniref:Glycosyl hydrolase family 98 putative carbohydrate-binding module domain-containing protein n=1 Tax=Fulvitalea axinellae TaxID=1182444 RepID=A0AAU9DBD0_9BACT|nr:hypothetical protein FUAX_28380 [Fulvitalea axinellae]